jgi:hypothetical protein
MSADNNHITGLTAQINSLLLSKEKELNKREADFDRRVSLYETDNPTMGNDTDIIQLNVGGSQNIAVLRRTLTQFEDSVLAAKFSGRWDDSMEKDRDGNIFIDQNFNNFQKLLDYLRMRMNSPSKQVPEKHRPTPTYSFCSMLEYYSLMPAVYPHTWVGRNFSREEISYGTVVLSTKRVTPTAALAFYDVGAFKKAGVSEFTVEFEKGTKGIVGWVNGTQNKDHVIPQPYKIIPNSIFLNVTERKILGPDTILKENMNIDHIKSATKIVCRHDGKLQYSIEVLDDVFDSSTSQVAEATLVRSSVGSYPVFPFISFIGKVKVSDLKYAIDEL